MNVVDDTIARPTSASLPDNRAASPIRVGSMIGRYLVISRLGAGGMGVVFSAYDPELDRRLALKLVRADRRTDTPDSASRLLREAQAMAKLDHPNVVTVHDVGVHEGAVFIAMEFVEGKTLRGWLDEAPRRVDEVLPVFTQVARGLAAAHEIGLVHRDIKPDNIIVGDDGRVRVMDFGLVRAQRSLHEGVPALAEGRALEPEAQTDAEVAGDAMARVRERLAGLGKLGPATPSDEETLDATLASDPEGAASPAVEPRDALDGSLTRSGALLGTPAYMAPEQVLGRDVDGRSDQFALCICLFEAVHHERPFQGDTLQELVGKIVRGQITEPARRARLPGFVNRAISRGLSVRPEDRFANMRALQDALEPPRTRRLVAGGVGLSVAAAVGAWAMHSPEACSSDVADQSIAAIWNRDIHQEMADIWAAPQLPYTGASLDATSSVLDEYVERWRHSWMEACAATHVEHLQSEALLDKRMACLETRRSALAGLVAVLRDPTPSDLEHARAAADALPEISQCDDTEALLADVEPPSDPQVRQQTRGLEGELAQVTTLRTLGHYDQAVELGTRLLKQATALSYEPSIARVNLELGRTEELRANYADAAKHLRAAAHTARANRDDETAAAAETELVFTVGYRLADSTQGTWWAEQADAAVLRSRSGELLRARLTNYRGVLLFESGDRADALRLFEHAVRGYASALSPSHLETLEVKYNLGVALRRAGRFPDAERIQREVLVAREEILGPQHPEVGKSLHALANALTEQRDVAAGPLYDRAVALLEAAVGPEHPRTAAVLLGRGGFLDLVAGDRKAARADFSRALSIYTQALGPEHRRTLSAKANLARLDAKASLAPEPSSAER